MTTIIGSTSLAVAAPQVGVIRRTDGLLIGKEDRWSKEKRLETEI
jgi:hypothetical protein